MFSLQINITPQRWKEKCDTKRNESREPTNVVLAPFSAKAIVTFEQVPITKTARRVLNVFNPSAEEIKVLITKSLNPQYNIKLEWTKNTIPAQTQITLEIEWSPLYEIACKETIQFTDSRNFQKDVTIIMKSIDKTKTGAKRFPTLSSGPLQSKTLKLNKNSVQSKKRSNILSCAEMWNQRNTSNDRALLEKQDFNFDINTFAKQKSKTSLTITKTVIASKNKENVSPTPTNASSMFDSIKFTPATITKSKSSSNLEYLASLPTPVDFSRYSSKNENNYLCPKKLPFSPESPGVTNISNKQIPAIAIVPISELQAIGPENFNLDQTYVRDFHTMNRTFDLRQKNIDKLNHPLIENEIKAQQQNNDTNAIVDPTDTSIEKAKRDVKLISTPLRKYSESMKNLSSTKTPQFSYAIQGSMPNLNNMESIQSIDHNRYYYYHQQSPPAATTSTKNVKTNDSFFDQNEILAASSRFNVNEVEQKRLSPIFVKQEIKTPSKSQSCLNNSNYQLQKRTLEFETSLSLDSIQVPQNCSIFVSPPKRSKIESHEKSDIFNKSKGTNFQNKKIRIQKTLKLVRQPVTSRKIKTEIDNQQYNDDVFIRSYINPDPFAATTTCDPFLSHVIYLDDRSIKKNETHMNKWLNALVSMPAELDPNCDDKIDIGKIFNEVRNKELILAPTKEEQSMNYLTKARMGALRHAAFKLYMNEEMSLICGKISVYIKKGAIKMRPDRDLHLDVVMQRNILELLLCFNPMWLRIGLEVVFNEVIHLHSNSDILGLSTFIVNRLFKDKTIEEKYSRAFTLSKEYSEHIKTYSLQKFLFLFLFLDKAKNYRIIKHNPCLFVKKSKLKETRDILCRFSSELLGSVGDITKELKRMGYVLSHKQTYLDEFNYAFTNLAIDLRDGVRLTRVMEIILLRDDLTKQLRCPAISRLQKIFNVNLGLKALAEANFDLNGNITSADIVDGHREKTLSLVWQIIYKFRAPKFVAAATTIQKWWRKLWLRVEIQRRIYLKTLIKQTRAATIIQSAFRGYMARKYAKVFKWERTNASICLQKYFRKFLAIKKIKRIFASILSIQRWYRNIKLQINERKKFIAIKNSALVIQLWYRRIKLARKLDAVVPIIREAKLKFKSALTIQLFFKMLKIRRDFTNKRMAIIKIQMYWRSYQLTRFLRAQFIGKKQAAIAIQQYYRRFKAMRIDRDQFVQLKCNVLIIQRRFRANRLCKIEYSRYENIMKSVLLIQKQFRSTLVMRKLRTDYLYIRKQIVFVQQRFRANRLMRIERANYNKLKSATIVFQRRYIAQLKMHKERTKYQHLRNSTIKIQRQLRCTLLTRELHFKFLEIQYYTKMVQQRFRANCCMRRDRDNLIKLKTATINIQRHYRANILMRVQQMIYLQLKRTVITIQQRYRANCLMRFHRKNYMNLKKATCVIQQRYRAQCKMFYCRSEYLILRSSTIRIQRQHRANKLMKVQRNVFLNLKNACIKIQQKLRATLLMRKDRNQFLKMKSSAIFIQTIFRSLLTMKMCRIEYLQVRKAVFIIQNYFRSYLLMKSQRNQYIIQRKSAIQIQTWYRSQLLTKKIRHNFLKTITSISIIQQHLRATLQTRKDRSNYLKLKETSIIIQTRFRSFLLMKKERAKFLELRRVTIICQQRYRANREMLKLRNQYLLIRSLTICVQRKFRALCAMREERNIFLNLKKSTIFIQEKFRGKIKMFEERARFLEIRKTILNLQTVCRGFLARKRFNELMTPEMEELIKQKKAAKLIQRVWRGYCVRKKRRNIKLLLICEKLCELRKNANKYNTVRYKISSWVKFLKGRYNVQEALSVLTRLQNMSRTVPHFLMNDSCFISTFCYGIMAQANRSEVDKKIIELCSRIILNLARYNSESKNIFQENGLVTIAQMLLRWCDKDCDIFNTLCTLIYIFAQCPIKNKKIRSFMIDTEAIFMLRETKKLVLRKVKMRQNVRKLNFTIVKIDNAENMKILPSLEPDYGIIRDKPYAFTNEVYALEVILNKLNIKGVF